MQPDQQTHQQATLIEVASQFQSWRAGRQRGARIPSTLWQSATSLAATHGVSRVSMALTLHYYALKKRLDTQRPGAKQTRHEPSRTHRFVEVPRPIAQSTITCAIEIEKPCHAELGGKSGHTKLRVELQDVGLTELDALLRSMWSERP